MNVPALGRDYTFRIGSNGRGLIDSARYVDFDESVRVAAATGAAENAGIAAHAEKNHR